MAIVFDEPIINLAVRGTEPALGAPRQAI